MEAIAKTKYLKGSPRKARLVIDMIRGQNVSRALSILKFTQKRAAQPIAKCLNSAIANATYNAEQQNIAIDPDDLWVKACYVDMGPTKHRRRMRPAPQGRAYREQRHYCHITIEVTSEEKPKTEKELKAEAAKARRAETKRAEPKKAAKKDAAKAPKAKKDEAAETAAPVEETVEAAPAVEETVETAPAAEETVAAQAEEVAAEDAAPAAEEVEKTEGETEAETK
ncbi:MAG: 50S ribosomal protein L22 [Acidobacteria bacterium]|nr:50S ribosomal protein L22 [Acidobacteriota bacterium]